MFVGEGKRGSEEFIDSQIYNYRSEILIVGKEKQTW